MHLDTVCTMVDVDKIVMYPNVADTPDGVRRDGRDRRRARRRPGAARRRGRAVPGRRGQGDGDRHPAPDRHRPRPGHRRARAVGRRQQHPGHRAAGGGRLRAQRSRPTPGSRRPASRWSRSPAPSSAPAAAARAACPARSAATRWADSSAGRWASTTLSAHRRKRPVPAHVQMTPSNGPDVIGAVPRSSRAWRVDGILYLDRSVRLQLERGADRFGIVGGESRRPRDRGRIGCPPVGVDRPQVDLVAVRVRTRDVPRIGMEQAHIRSDDPYVLGQLPVSPLAESS